MISLNETKSVQSSCEQETPPSGDVKIKEINGTIYEVVSNYIGKCTLLDVIKGGIKRDIESGNF